MKILVILLILGLILIPINVTAQEFTQWPPVEWQEEYSEWVAEQQALQQEYTNQTGHGLGFILSFIQWANMKADGGYWEARSHLFADSTGERRSATWYCLI